MAEHSMCQPRQMKGLIIMLVGLALLIGALFIYNKPFTDKR